MGIVEAPRGTLTHHYVTDENGIVKKANLVVGTTNNHAAICMSIKKAAQGLINKGVDGRPGYPEHDRNGVPRLRPVLTAAPRTACPGEMPLIVRVRDVDGTVLSEISR